MANPELGLYNKILEGLESTTPSPKGSKIQVEAREDTYFLAEEVRRVTERMRQSIVKFGTKGKSND